MFSYHTADYITETEREKRNILYVVEFENAVFSYFALLIEVIGVTWIVEGTRFATDLACLVFVRMRVSYCSRSVAGFFHYDYASGCLFGIRIGRDAINLLLPADDPVCRYIRHISREEAPVYLDSGPSGYYTSGGYDNHERTHDVWAPHDDAKLTGSPTIH